MRNLSDVFNLERVVYLDGWEFQNLFHEKKNTEFVSIVKDLPFKTSNLQPVSLPLALRFTAHEIKKLKLINA